MNRPRSRRLENRHNPSPSNQRTFTISPRRPLKTKTWPENGCSLSTVCTFALKPSKPRRMSVTPAAPAKSSSRYEVQSLAQTLKNRTQQRGISAALDTDHRPSRKLDVDRAGAGRLMLVGRLPCLRLTRSSHCNRKQSCARGRGLNQLAALECTSPLKHLVRVQPMRTCNQRHARAWLQCQIYDLPLLCNRPKSANPTFRSRCLFHDHMVRLKPAQMPEGKTTRLRRRQKSALRGC